MGIIPLFFFFPPTQEEEGDTKAWMRRGARVSRDARTGKPDGWMLVCPDLARLARVLI